MAETLSPRTMNVGASLAFTDSRPDDERWELIDEARS